MKKRIVIPVLLLLVSSYPSALAQKDITGLLRELKQAPPDTAKVNLYYSISRLYWYQNVDSAILMAQQGLDLAQAIHFEKGEALHHLSLGVTLGTKGNYPEALKHHLESLKISEELKMEGLSGNTYSNIAIVYLTLGNSNKAIEYFNKSLGIAEKYGEAATCPQLLNLCDLYTKNGRYDTAMKYGVKALDISRRQQDSSTIAISLFNISEVYKKTNRIDSARLYLNESLAMSARIDDDEGVSFCLNSLAEISANQGLYRESIVYAEKSLVNLERVKNHELLQSAYHVLYECYSGLKDFKKALHYRNLEITLKDNIFTIEKERVANNLLNQYNLERKQLQIELLEKNEVLQQKELARESMTKRIYGGGAILLALLTIYFIFSNIRWKSYNKIIKERNALIHNQKTTIIEQKVHLEKLNSVKDKIISIISHDFRSPLHTLYSFLQLLKMGALKKEDITRVTERIEKGLIATLEMIENLLAWGSSQMSGMTLNRSVFDFQEIASNNVELVQLHSENKRITIVNNVTTPTLVFADKDTISIVLRNLISNAIKFSRPNDHLFISASEDEHVVTVAVKDTGIGISPERQKTLFDNLLSFTTVGTSNEKGTGLGLALCQELVHQNGGKIWVESTLNAGSTFSFTVPRAESIDS